MGDASIKGRSPLLKGGRVGLKQGGAFGPLRGTTAGGVAKAFRGKAGFKESQALQSKIVKGTPIRKEYASLKRAHRLRQKNVKTKERILKERAGRKSSEAFHTKYIKPQSQATKAKWSQGQHPKSWRRAGKS